MTLAAKLCEHKTFVLTSLKKCDFNDSNNEHQHVPPVQHSLVPVHHQVTQYDVGFWGGRNSGIVVYKSGLL